MEGGKIQGKKAPAPQKRKKRARRTGSGVMRKAANEVLKEEGPDIVIALAQDAKEGHVQSARFLLALAIEEESQNAEKCEKKESLATKWSSEPEWPHTEPTAEAGFDGAAASQ